MKKIVYLPLDERPCNYDFASMLSEGVGDFYMVKPQKQLLGFKKRPAGFEGISNFLKRECKDAHALILSFDMLLYGGIVPSRLHGLSLESLEERIGLVKQLKAENPKLKIYAFALIMRCPQYSSSDEEPDYYELFGKEIFLHGKARHMTELGLISEDEGQAEQARLMQAIDAAALEDFLARRRVNLAALKDILRLVGKEVDKLIIPQDDSAPYGYTAMDQAVIKQFIAEEGITAVDVYPGADEVGMTLLAYAINAEHKDVIKIYPVYPDERCKRVIPLYEDREVEKSIKSQIENAGALMADSEADADILLFCNLPVGEMRDSRDGASGDYSLRNIDRFTQLMKRVHLEGRAVAAADIAFCNGGDVEWVKLIQQEIGVFNLHGYAGWNTSSNTLGTVICQAVIAYRYGFTPAHLRFTALRIYEDAAYCAYVRKYVCDNILPDLGYNYFKVDKKQGVVSEAVRRQLEAFVEKSYPEVYEKYAVKSCEMPWVRMFEVGLQVDKR